MPYNTNPALLNAIKRYGGDPEMQATMLATSWVESGGNPYGAGGDGGRSWGAFQEYDLGRGAGLTKQQRQDPVGSTQRAYKEFKQYSGRGLRGGALAAAAQRPANQAAYTQKVNALLGEARKALGGAPASLQQAAPSFAGGRIDAESGGPKAPDLGASLAQGITNRKEGEGLSTVVAQAVMGMVGQPAMSQRQGVKVNPTGTAVGQQGRPGVVGAAERWLGTPYSWGGGTPKGPSKGIGRGANTTGFDCSSLVQNAWAASGVSIPRTTYAQLSGIRTKIDPNNRAAWRPGDLIYPHSGHVQMYIGNGKVIHAPRTGGVVEIVPVGRVSQVRRPG